MENSKFEYRNVKQIQNPNVQMLKTGKKEPKSLVVITYQTIFNGQ
jgi:hypothetical protein